MLVYDKKICWFQQIFHCYCLTNPDFGQGQNFRDYIYTRAGGCCGRRGGSLLKYWFGSCPGRCGQTTLLRVRNIYIRSKYSNPHPKLTQCPSCTNTWKLGSYLMNSIIFINGSNYSEFRVRITLLSWLPSSLLTNIISIPRTTRLWKIKTNVNGGFKTV